MNFRFRKENVFFRASNNVRFPYYHYILFSFVFWLGDFNFRNECDGAFAKGKIKSGDLASLLKVDQVIYIYIYSASLYAIFS